MCGCVTSRLDDVHVDAYNSNYFFVALWTQSKITCNDKSDPTKQQHHRNTISFLFVFNFRKAIEKCGERWPRGRRRRCIKHITITLTTSNLEQPTTTTTTTIAPTYSKWFISFDSWNDVKTRRDASRAMHTLSRQTQIRHEWAIKSRS